MKPRMSGNWCVQWERAAHVVQLDRGWYRIEMFTHPYPSPLGGTVRRFVGAVYATNRIDAIARAKEYVSGNYVPAKLQPRLF